MSRTTTRGGLRLAAGTLALALPLAAAAGCGIQKKQSVKEEFSAAVAHLKASDAVSFTLHLADAKGNLAKAAGKDGSMPVAVKQALLKASITITVDGKSASSLQGATCTAGKPADLTAVLTKAAMSISVKDDTAELAELRLVGGDLYAHIGLKEIGRLATAAGAANFDQMLDRNLGGTGSPFAQGLTDVRAGKWLKLSLAKYLPQLKSLAGSLPGLGAAADPCKAQEAGKSFSKDAYAAVKPFVKVTDANDSSSNRVLDVNVRVRPALKALLSVAKSAKGLPFGMLLKDATPAKVDSSVKDGTVHGTITLANGHLKQLALDLEPIRQLSKDPGTDTMEGVSVIVDVNDQAAAITAPTNVSSLDLFQLFSQFLGGMMAGRVQGSSSSTTMGLGVN